MMKDLVDDDVMFLDSGDEVYIWIGKDSDSQEKDQALDLATKYLDSDPTERWMKILISILLVKIFQE